MAWGGSIAGVAQNELVLSAQQRAAHERDLEMLLHSQQQARENANQTRQLDQRDASQAQQQRQFDTSMSADAAREGRLGRFNDATLQLHRDEMAERGAERKSNEDWRRKVFTMNESEKTLRDLLPAAQEMADNGMFENTEDVIKHFPSLTPQAPFLSSRSKAARLAFEKQFDNDQSDADVLNRNQRLTNMINAEGVSSWNDENAPHSYSDTYRGGDIDPKTGRRAPVGFWFSGKNTPDKSAIQDWTTEQTSIAPARSAITADRNRTRRLTPDGNGMYAPSMQLPWRTGGNATSTSTARPNADAVLQEAQRAIQAGKDPQAVRQRLIQMGVQPNF